MALRARPRDRQTATDEGACAILLDIDADALVAAQAELGPRSCATFLCDIADAAAQPLRDG